MRRSTACASCSPPSRASRWGGPSTWPEVAPAPSSGRFAATFSPLGRRGGRQRATVSSPPLERSAERSGGWVRGPLPERGYLWGINTKPIG
ncbi:hypothetical protein EN935_05380 [Mesorhizobium sp. M7D.F.Ca.US.004.03.1.1]|nr:hypothetical protein EN993_19755 [Mesorhizobium sp. M7D.F.Ca.US.004.01.2.1]RVA34940.1 hypothetical protein EN935_05380 [Mesorhizobium sp. M7D.F.Ca.US.004.03.1.1]